MNPVKARTSVTILIVRSIILESLDHLTRVERQSVNAHKVRCPHIRIDWRILLTLKVSRN